MRCCVREIPKTDTFSGLVVPAGQVSEHGTGVVRERRQVDKREEGPPRPVVNCGASSISRTTSLSVGVGSSGQAAVFMQLSANIRRIDPAAALPGDGAGLLEGRHSEAH